MKINTNSIRLTGTYEIPGPLEIDDEVEFVVVADVVKREEKSLQNGEIDVVYILKAMKGPDEVKVHRVRKK